jgi:hypothetical protein
MLASLRASARVTGMFYQTLRIVRRGSVWKNTKYTCCCHCALVGQMNRSLTIGLLEIDQRGEDGKVGFDFTKFIYFK